MTWVCIRSSITYLISIWFRREEEPNKIVTKRNEKKKNARDTSIIILMPMTSHISDSWMIYYCSDSKVELVKWKAAINIDRRQSFLRKSSVFDFFFDFVRRTIWRNWWHRATLEMSTLWMNDDIDDDARNCFRCTSADAPFEMTQWMFHILEFDLNIWNWNLIVVSIALFLSSLHYRYVHSAFREAFQCWWTEKTKRSTG